MSAKPVKEALKWVEGSLRKKSHGPHYAPSKPQPAAGPKAWVHPPDVLNYGRVEYAVRFLGDVQVSQAKGTETIKEAIQKIRFQLQVRRSEAGTSGSKLPKVSLHINVDGVTVAEPKSRLTLHRYPLHRISFCADDKADPRLFSFIAKGSADEDGRPSHRCFVFLSEKLAEEITLTIGEAFDLAYRKFLDKNGRDLETRKALSAMKRRVGELEAENAQLKSLLSPDLLNSFLAQQQVAKRLSKDQAQAQGQAKGQGQGQAKLGWEDFGAAGQSGPRPPPPNLPLPPLPGPSNGQGSNGRSNGGPNEALLQSLARKGPSVGAKLENLDLDAMEDIFDDSFDPRAGEPGGGPRDPFGQDPFAEGPSGSGPSGSGPRSAAGADEEPSAAEMEEAIAAIDSRLAEMAEGFSAGLDIPHHAELGGPDGALGDLAGLDPFASPPNTQPAQP